MLLNESHYEAVAELIKSNEVRLINGYDIERGLFWIKEAYLQQRNGQFMFGSFVDGELVSIYTVRLNYPKTGEACVGNFFTKPKCTDEIVKTAVIGEAYRFAVDNRCEVLYSCVVADRFYSQWKFVQRYCEYVKKFYGFGIQQYIPVGEVSNEDWINSLMGRKASPQDCMIRRIVFYEEW